MENYVKRRTLLARSSSRDYMVYMHALRTSEMETRIQKIDFISSLTTIMHPIGMHADASSIYILCIRKLWQIVNDRFECRIIITKYSISVMCVCVCACTIRGILRSESNDVYFENCYNRLTNIYMQMEMVFVENALAMFMFHLYLSDVEMVQLVGWFG